jgi:hypothetical protein
MGSPDVFRYLLRVYFVPRPVDVGFVVGKVALGHFFFEYFDFPLPESFHQCPILIFNLSTTDAV